MLSDTLTLNNGAADQTFQLVSRVGMDSMRRNTTAGVTSSENFKFVVKNTIDDKKDSKPNRHLILVTATETDANGVKSTAQVHRVITRSKGFTDAGILKLVAIANDFDATPANVSATLIGGN